MQRVFCAALVAAATAQAAHAQPSAETQTSASKAVTTPILAPYRSAFTGFRPFGDETPQDWRRVNDEMQRLGGHAGHLRPAPPDKVPVGASGRPTQPEAPPAQEKRK